MSPAGKADPGGARRKPSHPRSEAMPTRPQVFRPHGVRGKAERNRAADARRGSAQSRGYTGAWAKASKAHLARHPLCAYCALEGRAEPATLTDHLYPHHGDRDLFWRSVWWVSACETCHSGFKQRLERQGLPALHRLADRLALPRLTAGVGGSKSSRPAEP